MKRKVRNLWKWRRQIFNISQKELGLLCSVPQSEISRLETNSRRPVSVNVREKLSGFLGIDLDNQRRKK